VEGRGSLRVEMKQRGVPAPNAAVACVDTETRLSAGSSGGRERGCVSWFAGGSDFGCRCSYSWWCFADAGTDYGVE
jgi:hypothetical protein